MLTHELGHAIGQDHAAEGVMEGRLAAGERIMPTDTQAVAAARGDARAAWPGAPVAAAAAAAQDDFSIDWSVKPRTDVAGLPTALRDKAPNWQDRFVSHLGADAARLNPNAALRLHLDAAPKVSKGLTMRAS